MAVYDRYRGAGGRFITKIAAEQLGSYTIEHVTPGEETQVEQVTPGLGIDFPGIPVEEEAPPIPEANWSEEESKYGAIWTSDDGFLDFQALQDAEFPEGFSSYRIRYEIEEDPDYPKGFATSTNLFPDQWPPSMDMIEGVNAVSIAQIIFKKA